MDNLNLIIAITSASIQTSITLFVCVIGAIHVRRCLNEQSAEGMVVYFMETDSKENSNNKIEKLEKTQDQKSGWSLLILITKSPVIEPLTAI